MCRSFQDNAVVTKAAVKPLIELLGSDSQPARALAARTLGRFQAKPEVVLPALIKTAKEDSDSVVRTSALFGIESIFYLCGFIALITIIPAVQFYTQKPTKKVRE